MGRTPYWNDPQIAEQRAHELDPDNLLCSDLARRLWPLVSDEGRPR